VRRDRKSKRGSNDRIDIRGKFGAAGGYIKHLAFVAANVVVERYPGTMLALFPCSDERLSPPGFPQCLTPRRVRDAHDCASILRCRGIYLVRELGVPEISYISPVIWALKSL
jgi:hypothetical protein